MKKAKKIIGFISTHPSWEDGQGEKAYTQRFFEEIKKLGRETNVYYIDKFCLKIEGGEDTVVLYEEKPMDLKSIELLIPMTGGITDRGDNGFFIQVLEEQGVKIKNSFKASDLVNNKIKTYHELNKAGLPIIPSFVNFSEYGLGPVFDYLPEDEYICKISRGSWGKGVTYLKSKISLITFLETVASLDKQTSNFVIQKYIGESKGRDLRVIVAGKEVIASMERNSPSELDFRANLWGGGKGTKIKLDDKLKKIAIKAVNVLGLDFGGVDFLITKDGHLITEVNPMPGLKIESITGINVVKKILKNIV